MTGPFQYLLLHAFILVLSVVTALLEIQIEGKNGWASKLPTWRIAPQWFRKLTNRVELTGYHFFLNIFLLLLFHFPVLLIGWSWFLECTILSCYFTFNIVWDFLWFVLNPAYGWERYTPKHVWWFERWLGPFPVDYYVVLVISGLFAALRGMTADATGSPLLAPLNIPQQQIIGWACGLLITIGLTVLLTAVRSHLPVTKQTRLPAAFTILPAQH